MFPLTKPVPNGKGSPRSMQNIVGALLQELEELVEAPLLESESLILMWTHRPSNAWSDGASLMPLVVPLLLES